MRIRADILAVVIAVGFFFMYLFAQAPETGGNGGAGGVLDIAIVERATAQSGIGNNTKIAIDSIVLQGTGSLSADVTTNDRIDILEDGVYMITGSMLFEAITNGYITYIKIYVDGTEVASSGGQAGNTPNFSTGEAVHVMELTAGQYVELWARVNVSTMTSVENAGYRPRLQIMRLR